MIIYVLKQLAWTTHKINQFIQNRQYEQIICVCIDNLREEARGYEGQPKQIDRLIKQNYMMRVAFGSTVLLINQMRQANWETQVYKTAQCIK